MDEVAKGNDWFMLIFIPLYPVAVVTLATYVDRIFERRDTKKIREEYDR